MIDYAQIMQSTYCRLTGAREDGVLSLLVREFGQETNRWHATPSALRDYYHERCKAWFAKANDEAAREDGDSDLELSYRNRSMAYAWCRDEVVRIFRTGWGA
jgi:hypothetical protein